MADFDDILIQIGEFGRYQRWIFFVCLCTLHYYTAFNTMGIVFLAASPNHWCLTRSIQHLNLSQDVLMNLTIPKEYRKGEEAYDQCHRYDIDYSNWTKDDVLNAIEEGSTMKADVTKCNDGWVYDDSIYKSTIVTEWNLVCDQRHVAATATAVYMAGVMLGAMAFGVISDRYGRKLGYGLSLLLTVISGILTITSVNHMMLLISRFLMGMGTMGSSVTAYVLAVELVGPSWRVVTGMSGAYVWSLALLIIPGLAYLIRTWRALAMALFLPTIVNLFVLSVIPESPRWLYSQNKHEKADRIVRKMARCNGRKVPEKLEVEVKTDPSTGVFLDLLRHKRLRTRAFNVCFQWCTVAMVYYGLSLGTPYLSGNPYVNFVIGAALEVPGVLTAHLAVHYLGRRYIYSTFMLLCGIVLCVMPFIPKGITSVEIGLAMTGRFFVAGAFILITFYTTELFPTVVRSVALSAGSSSGRIGGIIAPYLANQACSKIDRQTLTSWKGPMQGQSLTKIE